MYCDFDKDSFWSSLSIGNNNSNTSYNFAGGTIINNCVNSNYILPQNVESDIAKVEKALKQHHFPGAPAEAQTSEAGCMPGTRVKLLEDVLALLRSHTAPHIVWIAGMAGTGKTSIALTLCRMLWLDESMFLGGSFFCSRSAGSVERTDVKRIVPTLATLLARQYPWFASYLAKQISETPDVAHWSVRSQIEQLIEQPLAELALETCYTGQIVFVIDALDECNNPSLLAELIDSIADFQCKLPVRFLLTSRPEMHIRTTSISDPVLSSILILHTVDPEQVTKDIHLYIGTKLAQASKRAIWYSVHDVDALVTLSGGLFIFASTVLMYVLNRGDDARRRERLWKAITAFAHSTVATSPLDRMYELVITEASRSDQVDTDELGRMRKMLACVLTARASLSVQALADLIGFGSDTLRGSLERLHSLVHLPGDDNEPGVRALHASFGDYMLGRAADHIRLAHFLGHDLLAAGCLRRMSWSDLCFQISCSFSSYEPNEEYESDSISLSLIYACLHWAHHIDAASIRSAYDSMVGGIFRPKFLFWLEVLSIMGNMSVASGLLRIASSAVDSKSQEVARFLRDANSFVASSYAAIALSAPHIYLSAIPFASKDSLIYKDFSPLCTGVVSVETFGTDHHASHLVMTLTGHEDYVNAVAYSPSNQHLASGSGDGSVRIWDTRTGEEVVSPMRSGDGAVCSVAFSLDGHHVASGATNGVVSVWSVATGRPESRRPLAHRSGVDLLAFSPDGKRIASVSWCYYVELWSMETGQIVSAPVSSGCDNHISLSFSPDGTILTLRSCNREELWYTNSTQPGLQLVPCHEHVTHGHASSSRSSRFSLTCDPYSILLTENRTGRVVRLPIPDDHFIAAQFSADESCLIASVAQHASLRLWDLRCIDTDPQFITLGGHTDTVIAVSSSSDGTYWASGSRDFTIRIWDTAPGYEGAQRVQDDGVGALAVSLDDSLIICGRDDGFIQVYDVGTGKERLRSLIGHKKWVTSVAISPNGQTIASGSADDTIRLWCIQTGAPIGEPFGHQPRARVLTFSPTTQWLASGSFDKTVFVWEVATRKSLGFAPMVCEDEVMAVAFLPGEPVLAASDYRGRIYFWNLERGQLVHQLKLDHINSLAFAPSASRLLASSRGTDCSIYIDDVNTKALDSWKVLVDGEFISAQWSPCERYIAVTLEEDQTVRLFDRTHNVIIRLQGNKSDFVSSMAFASDGRFVVSGAGDGVIRLWDVEDARSLASRTEHDPVARLASAEIEDGWLIGPSGELLLWVPADYHGYLQFPPHKATVLGERRIIVTVPVGDGGLHWDDDWHTCWRGALS